MHSAIDSKEPSDVPDTSSAPFIRNDGGSKWCIDALGLGCIIAAALVVLTPALLHGKSLGPYDWLSSYGVLQQPAMSIHDPFSGDQITQMIPWSTLAWNQIHHGYLPLWNPYSALGMPLAFNWQSAAFSLPALISYLFPSHLVYTIQILVTLLLAGTGAYFLARILRLGMMACVFVGIAFELSGPFMVWLGWPISSVFSWSGWLFGSILLIFRGQNRFIGVALFSIAFAFAVYAGQPDALILLIFVLVVFILVLLVHSLLKSKDMMRSVWVIIDLAIAWAVGAALAAPLLLPGLQLIGGSIRAESGSALNSQRAIPTGDFLHQLLQGLVGSPIYLNHQYVGVIPIVLALVAVVVCIRKPEVLAFAVIAVFSFSLTYLQPVISSLNSLPGLHSVRFPRAIAFLALAIIVLAGIGLNLLVYSSKKTTLAFAGLGFAVVGTSVIITWAIDGDHLSRVLNRIPLNIYLWSAVSAVVGVVTLGIALTLLRSERSELDTVGAGSQRSQWSNRWGRGWWVGLVLLICETVFLVSIGTSLWSSTPGSFPTTPAARALQRAVGSSLVGLGQSQCFLPPGLGFPVNTNIVYGVHELAVYDPLVPSAYYEAWKATTGQQAGFPEVSHYCPGVRTASLARLYGVGFVLEPHSSAGPRGGVFDRQIGGEDLYRIRNSALVTLTPSGASGELPPDEAAGVTLQMSTPNPAVWHIKTDSTSAEVLRLRLTDVPGWRATIDGRPLKLVRFSGIMMQARLPAGRHIVELRYWPEAFSLGILLAAVGCIGLMAGLVGVLLRRRRTSSPRSGARSDVTSGSHCRE